MTKGWHFYPDEHAMASKGLKPRANCKTAKARKKPFTSMVYSKENRRLKDVDKTRKQFNRNGYARFYMDLKDESIPLKGKMYDALESLLSSGSFDVWIHSPDISTDMYENINEPTKDTLKDWEQYTFTVTSRVPPNKNIKEEEKFLDGRIFVKENKYGDEEEAMIYIDSIHNQETYDKLKKLTI